MEELLSGMLAVQLKGVYDAASGISNSEPTA
jgi:hypothetical protein